MTQAGDLWYSSGMAPRNVSIHLPHLLGAEGDVPERVQRLAEHYGDLVRFASQGEPGQAHETPVLCRRRPGRRACGGLLVVALQDAKHQVEWHCPNCKDAGVITGWKGTQADLRAMRRGSRQDVREVAVTVAAFAALRDVARADRELGRLAFTAQVGAGGLPVLFVGDDECERYRSRLAVEALRAAGRRAALQIMSIVDALAGSTGEEAGGGRLIELDASALPILSQLLRNLEDDGPPEYVFAGEGRRTKRIKALRRPSPKTFQIKVTLRDVHPSVWRRLLVPADILLPRLHEVLQAAMGWQDCHLHLFRVGDASYAPPGDWEPVGADSRAVALVDLAAKPGARLVYEYDFGDDWTHDIVVESVLPEPCKEVRCSAGSRCCPPEDCGGPFGYAEFLAAIADRSHERHVELCRWFGGRFDPAAFEVDEANAALRRLAVE